MTASGNTYASDVDKESVNEEVSNEVKDDLTRPKVTVPVTKNINVNKVVSNDSNSTNNLKVNSQNSVTSIAESKVVSNNIGGQIKPESKLSAEDRKAQIDIYSEPSKIDKTTGNLVGLKQLHQPYNGSLSGMPADKTTIPPKVDEGVIVNVNSPSGGEHKDDPNALIIPTTYINKDSDGLVKYDDNTKTYYDGKTYYYDDNYTKIMTHVAIKR